MSPVVLIRCFTYNQKPYILDALNGFCMQQTSFPYLCLVMDDASTDGTQEVIMSFLREECDMFEGHVQNTEYATEIIVPCKRNKNCTMIVYLLTHNLYEKGSLKMSFVQPWREKCQYEAICEGDDYWIDPCKLQKQVSFMKCNPRTTYLFTARYIDDERSGRRIMMTYRDRVYTTNDILSGFNPGLQTALIKMEIIKIPYIKGINGDRQYPYNASLYGEIRCINDVTSVYRVTGKGVSTSVKEEEWFLHALKDFTAFHKRLDVKEKQLYINGISRYIHSYLKTNYKLGVRLYNSLYTIIKQERDDFTKLDVIKLFFCMINRKFKRKLGLSDIKISII